MSDSARRILAAVRELAPAIAKAAPAMGAERRLSPAVVDDLKAIGIFRMLAPRSHDGLEIDYPPSIDVLAALAAADGATGWAPMIGCETPRLFALLPRATFDAIYSAGTDGIGGRDIHALTQHASVQENVSATAGAETLVRTGSFSPF